MNWRADNRKSQGRFTLEQIAGQVNGLDEHSIPPYCDESTTPPQPTTTTAATAAQKASSYGLSLYSAALSGWLGRPNTPGDDSTVREGGAERGGDASREALRQVESQGGSTYGWMDVCLLCPDDVCVLSLCVCVSYAYVCGYFNIYWTWSVYTSICMYVMWVLAAIIC